MASKCTKCGNTDSYNFALNIGLCNPCIGERIEELEADYIDLKEIQATDYNHAVRNAERIRELEAELEKHRWIPVSERLPENIADVFILTGGGSGGIGMYGEEPKGVFGWERLDHAINLNITHWKPVIAPKG